MKTLISFIFSIFLASASYSQTFSDGAAAARSGDFPAALAIWQPLAEAGDKAAQHNLGYAYDNGLGMEADDTQAAYWYQLAADQGVAASQVNLALLYARGSGVAQSYEKSFYLLQLAADQGDAGGQYNLGIAYVLGNGTAQNFTAAMELFLAAATDGYLGAENEIGKLYRDGSGVEQNYDTAAYWFELAAQKGDPKAQNNLGLAYANGNGVPQDYAKSFEYYTLAAQQDYPEAITNLGHLYDAGAGVAQNDESAARLYQRAANLGYTPAMTYLATAYEFGRGAPQDLARAMEIYEFAANRGDAEANYILGLIFLEGNRLVQPDVNTAVSYLLEAIKKDHKGAYYELGKMQILGNDTISINYEQAMTMLLSAGIDHGPALATIATLFQDGLGVEKNLDLAMRYYERAGSLGFLPAKLNLGKLILENFEGERAEQFGFANFMGAAQGGLVEAQINLGILYYSGTGTPVDKMKAYMWITIGARDGNPAALDILSSQDGAFTAEEKVAGRRLAALCLESGYQECG